MYLRCMGVMEEVGNSVQIPWILVRRVLLLPGNSDSFSLAPKGQVINERTFFLSLLSTHSLLTETG